MQANSVNTDAEGVIESEHIKWVAFRENERAFFPQGQSNLSVSVLSGFDDTFLRCCLIYYAVESGFNLQALVKCVTP